MPSPGTPIRFFFIVASCSIVVNNVFNFRLIFSLRLILRSFVFYLALINLGLTDGQLKKINTLLFILFIIQLPASAIKFYFYGVSEMTMGTHTVHGGGLTTLIPIIAWGTWPVIMLSINPELYICYWESAL